MYDDTWTEGVTVKVVWTPDKVAESGRRLLPARHIGFRRRDGWGVPPCLGAEVVPLGVHCCENGLGPEVK